MMMISDVFEYMNVSAVIRGDRAYAEDISLVDYDIEFIGGSVTDEEFHVSAGELLKEQLKTKFSQAIQNHVDSMARTKDYGDGNACATYANSSNAQWKAEADAFVAWRDDVWEYAYQEFAKFENGERQEVPIDDFINELPAIVWP